MASYKIVVAYDGTAYHGWQLQPDVTTISHMLHRSFENLFSKKVLIWGASRTDAGVHALGQVIVIKCDIDLPEEKILKIWNNALPNDIVIRSVQKLDQYIHPHKNVVQKTYWYHFFLERPLPFYERYGLFLQKQVNIPLLKEALQVFVGTHDFRSFCTGDEMESTVRTVDSVELVYLKEYNAYRIIVKGKGFLRYMVRRMVGAALEVASKDSVTVNDIAAVLFLKNPCHTLPNAPAKGLLLYEILYNKG